MSWNTESEQAKDLKGICEMLANLGCPKIQVSYDGSGDDGSINDVEFLTSNDSTFEEHILNKGNITETVREACYDILADQDFDWVNNEGGYGSIIIDTNAREYRIDHEIRIEITESSTHQGEL